MYINPDNIARDEFGDWNSPEAVMKAAQRAADLREECLRNKEGVLFETVLSVVDKLSYIQRAKEAGYFIRLFFVGTDDPSINAARVAIRVMENGHDVPIPKIINRYSKSIFNCSVIATLVDRLYVYDNSVDYAEPKLLFRASEGQIEHVYTDINPWALNIYHAFTEPGNDVIKEITQI